MHWQTWRDDPPRTLGQAHFTSCWRCPKISEETYEYFRLYFRLKIQIWMKYTFTVSRNDFFAVREILPRYTWKLTRTLTTLERSPVDAAMIRPWRWPTGSWHLIRDGHQYSPAQRILLRMGRKTDYSTSEQRLKVHYTLLKIVAIQWNNTH